jgi:D-mannonate dehydratase
VLFPILPQELVDYLSEQEIIPEKIKELTLAEQTINNTPLSSQVLYKIKEYSQDTENFCKMIQDNIPKIKSDLYNILAIPQLSEKQSQEVARYLNSEL